MAIKRTTKAVAKRIDLGYFKRFHALRSMRTVLAWLLSLITIAALGLYSYAFKGSSGVAAGIYNPGPVSRAHAYFEQDCKACHDSNGTGGFFKTVSDTACLKCHDGPLHDPHQATMIAADKNHHAPTDLTGQHMVAADCKSCHVEHRGHEALSATSDMHCTVCHANLQQNMKPGMVTKLKNEVTEFTVGNHPPFGRELAEKDTNGQPVTKNGQWLLVDNTVLHFNHKKHLGVGPIQGAEHNCTICHNVGTDPVAVEQYNQQVAQNPGRKRSPFPVAKEQPFVQHQPPFEVADRLDVAPLPLFDSNAADRRFMQSISYERNCSGCHALQVAEGLTISHDKLDVVRAQLGSLPQVLAQQIATDPDKEAKLTVKTTEGSGPRKKTVTKKVTQDEWVQLKLKEIYKNATDDKYADELSKAGGAAPGETDPGILEYYMVKSSTNSNRCSLCHEIKGDLPAVAAAKLGKGPATAPASGPSAAPMAEETVPTRIPTSPRRWFPDSHFTHDSHRNMECVACHGQALASEKTSDVLMPGIEACAGCHHPNASEARRSSGSDCVMCHNFHDRTRERSFDGTQDLKGEEHKAPATVAKGP